MADRVSATIVIGGVLPSALLDDLVATIQSECLSTEWDGETFKIADLPANGPLRLMSHEVAWGEFEELQAFCARNALPYVRWCDGCGSAWGAQRRVFVGTGEPVTYIANSDDTILIDRDTVVRLGSFADVVDHFTLAEFEVPALRIEGCSPPS